MARGELVEPTRASRCPCRRPASARRVHIGAREAADDRFPATTHVHDADRRRRPRRRGAPRRGERARLRPRLRVRRAWPRRGASRLASCRPRRRRRGRGRSADASAAAPVAPMSAAEGRLARGTQCAIRARVPRPSAADGRAPPRPSECAAETWRWCSASITRWDCYPSFSAATCSPARWRRWASRTPALSLASDAGRSAPSSPFTANHLLPGWSARVDEAAGAPSSSASEDDGALARLQPWAVHGARAPESAPSTSFWATAAAAPRVSRAHREQSFAASSSGTCLGRPSRGGGVGVGATRHGLREVLVERNVYGRMRHQGARPRCRQRAALARRSRGGAWRTTRRRVHRGGLRGPESARSSGRKPLVGRPGGRALGGAAASMLKSSQPRSKAFDALTLKHAGRARRRPHAHRPSRRRRSYSRGWAVVGYRVGQTRRAFSPSRRADFRRLTRGRQRRRGRAPSDTRFARLAQAVFARSRPQ